MCMWENSCVFTRLFRPVTWLRYQKKRRPTAVELNSPGNPVTMVRTLKLYFRKISAFLNKEKKKLQIYIKKTNEQILHFHLKIKCINPPAPCEFMCPWLCLLWEERRIFFLLCHMPAWPRNYDYFCLISPPLWPMTHYNSHINLTSCNNNKTSDVCSATSRSLSTGLWLNYSLYSLYSSCTVCFSFYTLGEWNRTFSYCWKEIRGIICKHHKISLYALCIIFFMLLFIMPLSAVRCL